MICDEDLDETVGRVPASCPDKVAAEMLCTLMEHISEDYYSAGWRVGLEFLLWKTSFEDQSLNFGLGPLSLSEIHQLIELTYRCQGWWIWWKNHRGRRFLTYDEWLPMYQRGYRY